MARVKNGVAHHKRVKKILKYAKGYRGSRSKWYRIARQSVIRSWQYAYRDRRARKRDFRRLWISRISSAVSLYGLNYSTFIHLLYQSDIQFNRKVLSNMAIEDPDLFKNLVDTVKKSVK